MLAAYHLTSAEHRHRPSNPVCVQEAAAAQRKKGRTAGGGSRAGGDRRPERPPQQRFASVEDHWRKLTPEQRHELLRLPVRDLLAGVNPFPAIPHILHDLASATAGLLQALEVAPKATWWMTGHNQCQHG